LTYIYAALTLARDGAPARRLAEEIKAAQTPAVQVLGQFAPQLGASSNEASLLLFSTKGVGAARMFLDGLSIVQGFEIDPMAPTARPVALGLPRSGGIYVHRWFVIEAEAVEEFVSLSNAAWPEFETLFDASIYGLFAVNQNSDDKNARVRRMLLITRYKDHGEWERSRDPTTAAMQTFMRRRALTRVTIARSSLLVEPL
jgi:hypothetical protein